MHYDLPEELVVTAAGPVRTITLNRPGRYNAVNHALHHGLADVWRQLAADADAGVVILTGAGDAFCAGGDVEFIQHAAEDPEHRDRMFGDARRIVTEMLAFPLPVIAAVNGPAIGLGCSLAVMSDIVLISESTYLADPHVSVGVVAADGGALCWPLLVSILKAKEYLFTGDRIPARTAVELGLANRAVPAADVLSDAHALARRLAAQAPQALRDTKRALNLHMRRAVEGVLDFAFSAESESLARPGFAASLDATLGHLRGRSA
jgi:enoyl-CoA hydratase